MALATDRKLYLGARLRRLRRELGLSQTRMAEEIGISASYLNHLERNQRPVTAQVLLRLTEGFDIDLRSFVADAEAPGVSELTEVFADPLFRDLGIPRQEVMDLADNAPGAAEAMLRLYRAFADRGSSPAADSATAGDWRSSSPAADWVQEYIQGRHNFFAELEDAAEACAKTLDPATGDLPNQLRTRLATRHKISVRVVPADVLDDALRHYDYHRRRLMLSELLEPSGRSFAMAYQLALLEMRETLDALLTRAKAPDAITARLLRVSLANYAAAALLMPYAAFHAAAENFGYDIGLLSRRFGVSFEQACHRLTTLGRSGARGIPFFMLRIDAAGNVSKRFAGATFPFSRFGGICPRWNIHSAFRTPGSVITQIIEMPDGNRYFTIARTVRRPTSAFTGEDLELAVGIGCELRHAARLVYAQGLDLAEPRVTPTGPSCSMCERPRCPQRAAPPANRPLLVDELSKSVTPYPFTTT